MKPYYDDGRGITIYHGDCREILPTLGNDFAVVSDPPYGMAWNTDGTRFSGGKFKAGRVRARPAVVADDVPFDPAPLAAYPRCLLWGFPHFFQRLERGTLLVWIKKPAERYGTFLSDADIGWMKGGHGIYVHYAPWEGIVRGDEHAQRSVHPTQKPLPLMRWCIEMAVGAADIPILDPYMGSGTTLRAAKDLGRRAIGIEIEERYCEVAAQRLSQEVLDLPRVPTGEGQSNG